VLQAIVNSERLVFSAEKCASDHTILALSDCFFGASCGVTRGKSLHYRSPVSVIPLYRIGDISQPLLGGFWPKTLFLETAGFALLGILEHLGQTHLAIAIAKFCEILKVAIISSMTSHLRSPVLLPYDNKTGAKVNRF
jgi:hypothetical protein